MVSWWLVPILAVVNPLWYIVGVIRDYELRPPMYAGKGQLQLKPAVVVVQAVEGALIGVILATLRVFLFRI